MLWNQCKRKLAAIFHRYTAVATREAPKEKEKKTVRDLDRKKKTKPTDVTPSPCPAKTN
jgi:hypothetical protein